MEPRAAQKHKMTVDSISDSSKMPEPQVTGSDSPSVELSWDSDPRNPFNWPLSRKWATMAVSYWVAIVVGINATSFTTAAEGLSEEFNVSNSFFEYSFFAVTSWTITAAIVPLVTLPMMESFGFRIGYVEQGAFTLFVIFIIPQCVAQNFATLVVCRIFAGAFGGTVQNAADGIAANIFFTAEERILPLTIYAYTLMFGVTIGPVFGAIFHPLGWRWVFWIQLIMGGATIPIVFFGMKETRGPVLMSKISNEKPAIDEPSALTTLKETVGRAAILLTTEPTVTSFTTWSAFSFGLVFVLTQSVPVVFTGAYGWPMYTGGVVQAAIAIGETVGIVAFLYQNKIYINSAANNPEKPGVPVPESILHLSIPSTIFGLAGGLFMYGWGSLSSYWIVPAIGLGLVGFGIMCIVIAAVVYVTDSYSGYAASAIAAVAFGENTFAALLPLAAKPMYIRLGSQWASSLLAFIALALTLAPTILLWKGDVIRSKSKAIKKMALY